MKYYKLYIFNYNSYIGKFCCYHPPEGSYIQFMYFADGEYHYHNKKYPASADYYYNKLYRYYYYKKIHIPNINSCKEWKKYIKLLAFQ